MSSTQYGAIGQLCPRRDSPMFNTQKVLLRRLISASATQPHRLQRKNKTYQHTSIDCRKEIFLASRMMTVDRRVVWHGTRRRRKGSVSVDNRCQKTHCIQVMGTASFWRDKGLADHSNAHNPRTVVRSLGGLVRLICAGESQTPLQILADPLVFPGHEPVRLALEDRERLDGRRMSIKCGWDDGSKSIYATKVARLGELHLPSLTLRVQWVTVPSDTEVATQAITNKFEHPASDVASLNPMEVLQDGRVVDVSTVPSPNIPP